MDVPEFVYPYGHTNSGTYGVQLLRGAADKPPFDNRLSCSGSVSYVMHAAGLLDWALDSTGFMRWGGGGPGSWVRIYANHEHVFAVIAGLRWDTSSTSEGDGHGPGWSEEMRSTRGFRLRHPLGLLAGPAGS